LFGSAATNEWNRGKSDIDFIVVVKEKNSRKRIEIFINGLIISLDKKYNLELIKTCSTYVKRKNPFVNLFFRIEDAVTFGKPFFVFSLNQIKFEHNTIKDSRINFISLIFDPLVIFLAKMKQTGKTIYGRNLISEISYNATGLEKVRVAFAPFWVLVMSIISFPFDENFSLKHSIKATLWACEDILFALDCPLSSVTKEVALIKKIFGTTIDLDHVLLSMKIKQLNRDFYFTKGFIAKHIIKTTLFIIKLYWKTTIIKTTDQSN
jgi:predicted nucleotidyltransferase